MRTGIEGETSAYLSELHQGNGKQDSFDKIVCGVAFQIFPGASRSAFFCMIKKIPQGKGDVIFALEKCFNIDMSVYRKFMEIRANNTRPSSDVLREIFEKLYHLLETVIKKVDEFEIKPV